MKTPPAPIRLRHLRRLPHFCLTIVVGLAAVTTTPASAEDILAEYPVETAGSSGWTIQATNLDGKPLKDVEVTVSEEFIDGRSTILVDYPSTVGGSGGATPGSIRFTANKSFVDPVVPTDWESVALRIRTFCRQPGIKVRAFMVDAGGELYFTEQKPVPETPGEVTINLGRGFWNVWWGDENKQVDWPLQQLAIDFVNTGNELDGDNQIAVENVELIEN